MSRRPPAQISECARLIRASSSIAGTGLMSVSPPATTRVVRQADCTLCRAARPRLTFSRMSEAVAVQMKGVGCSLCWAM